MISLRPRLKPLPSGYFTSTQNTIAASQPTPRTASLTATGHLSGSRVRIGKKIKNPSNANHQMPVVGWELMVYGRIAWTNSAKNAISKPRSSTNQPTRQVNPPFRIRRDSASGNAAPMEKRKNGNTRSTHVIPGSVPIHSCVGGGSCA